MPRPRSDTRARIVRSTRTLLRRQGYHGTGLAQIIEHSGAPRGSVYFLFPGGKEEIAVAAVAEWSDELDTVLRTTHAACASARAWVAALAALFAADLRSSQFTEGLPVTTVTLDSVPASPALTAACHAAYSRWLSTAAEGLRAYAVPDRRAQTLATLLLAALEGAAVLCRAYRSTGPLDDVTAELLSLLPETVTTDRP
ncbi:MAG: TetR/AcrR family transcriptional regulator, lmrAB and yxaGH operons repressor [Actinoplanes sp.]|nr:TetR/AcrR family transcriptional regulator, lmrAB and yxaGH operons repressor [Actinoplanes sp.]